MSSGLTADTAAQLRELFVGRRTAENNARQALDDLYLAVLRATEVEGATREEIANAVGVGTSTVQGWVTKAKLLRGTPRAED